MNLHLSSKFIVILVQFAQILKYWLAIYCLKFILIRLKKSTLNKDWTFRMDLR
jgi:hypothetical protein